MAHIGFNKPFMSGNELSYIKQALHNMKISGDGIFTQKCHAFFSERYKFKSVLLTTSCTDALEMAAILANIQQGDEVIVPSFTFVSTVNAFILRGANIVFADSSENSPNMDVATLKSLVSHRTKAIVPVHYAGIAVDMDPIFDLASEFNIQVIEDAAQAIDSYYKGRPLGSFGATAAFSFHETKNIISGEGGMIVINDQALQHRAEIIREKGTNRSAFFRGEVDKYGWVDIGSSFLPSDINAAFLYAQLECLENIQNRRKAIWQLYQKNLLHLELQGKVQLPYIPAYASNNGHMFYMVCKNLAEREALIAYLKSKGIHAVFHYQSLHKSAYFKDKHDGRELPWSDHYSDCLVRLPFYYELSDESVLRVCETIAAFYEKR